MRRYFMFAVLAGLCLASLSLAEVTSQYWMASTNGLQGLIDFHADKLPGMDVTPDGVDILPDSGWDGNFRSGLGDNYTANLFGWVTIPTTGTYTWHIACDDHGALYVGESMDEIIANYGTTTSPNLVASVDGWTNYQEWTKYPSQTSAPIDYVAGQTVALYAQMREGTGGDNLAVGWTLPGAGSITMLGENITNIPPDPVAAKPVAPQVGASDVLRDGAQLEWTAGIFASTHNVYLSTSSADVNDRAAGALVGDGLPAATTTLDPGRLAFGTTYYWTVDEVNGAPDFTVYPGKIWSFTIEPKALTATGVVASASSEQDANQPASRAVDGSGLSNGEHGTDLNTMWITDMADMDRWIQFDLGKVLKLDSAHVWNHNSQTEAFLGYGIQQAKIEISIDGAAWTELKTVTLAQAPGVGAYAGEDVALDGAVARFVKITALSNYSLLGLTNVGLAEIRFNYIPTYARELSPADNTQSAGPAVTASWRAGREAAEHQVVLSQDRAAVEDNSAVVGTTADTSLDLGTLDLAGVYFWKVNEVNEAETPSVYEGDVQVLLIPETVSIDDMEMYKAEDGLFIWQHWVDGFENADNGSVVGNGDDPETADVHQGSQAMPMEYDNVASPMSEATRSFDPPLDLTAGNPERIEMFYKGRDYIVNGYYSADGQNWTAMSWNPQVIPMTDDGYIGLAVTSHTTATATTAVFSSVTTTGGVSGDWAQANIGATTQPEDYSETGGVFTIKGIGADIWGTADDFRYVYKTLTGEGSITARVDSLEDVHDWAKAGVMIRDSLAPESSFGGILATPVGKQGVRWQARLGTGVGATSDSAVLDGTQQLQDPPTWVRIERVLANTPASIAMTLTDTSGKSATIESGPDATTTTAWTSLGAAPADLNVNLSQIASITVGVNGAAAKGRIVVDTIQTMTTRKPHYDLYGHWALDGDTTDSSGNGFDGVAVGDPNWVDGVSGQALEFSAAGNDDYVDLGTANPSLWSGQLSLAMWAKWNGLSDQWQGLIGKRDTWNGARMMWQIEANKNNGSLGFKRNGGGDIGFGTALTEGEWQHVGVSFDGTTAKTYLDGVQVGSGGFTLGTGTDSAMLFGACQAKGANGFNGALDEVYIYDRALSDAEIAGLAGK